MRTFTTYIEYLLMTRHYCYVPGKGAYMLGDETATMGTHPNIGADSRRLHQLDAPHRVIRFSPLHYHDDGMLANLLMEAEGMSFDEACRYIERQVALLPDNFHESASLHIDTENFGFGTLSLETWGDIEARKNAPAHLNAKQPVEAKHESDVIAIPRRWAQRVAVVLLVAVCFFASFLGLDDQTTQQQQYANVLDLTVLQRGAISNHTWEEDSESTDFSDENDSQSASDELGDVYAYNSEYDSELWSDEEIEAHSLEASLETEVSETIIPETDRAITVAPNGKLYYIIVASCPNQQDADRALGNLRKQGYNEVGILERDERFRLYINRFGDKAEAEVYLKSLRENDSFHSAWLLPVREASLSSIIKNTYNDNQLFMELSHLNQRTERDQG